MAKDRDKLTVTETPTKRAGFRDPDHVQSIVLRMGANRVQLLDELCRVNSRSRRELVEIFVAEAFLELQADPSARITPI